MLVPGDDPPFVTFHLHGAAEGIPLRARQGRELVRRLEADLGRQPEIVTRLIAASRGRYPQEFVAAPEDEPVLLAALAAPPALQPGRLADLRDALAARAP